LLAARLGQRGVADVVAEVEVDVVGPERPPGLQWGHDELLAEAGDQVEAPAHVLDQVDVAGRWPLEDQDRADVHMAGGALVGQERGVDGRQSVEMASLGAHRRSGYRYPEVMPSTAISGPRKVLLAAPRGYCAGVDRAVQTVERALEVHGAPVYVRKEIVHN